MENKKGFTIIELVVAIAIIAILAAIVMLNVTIFLQKGKNSAVKGQVEQLRIATADYYSNNGSYLNINPNCDKCNQIRANILKLGGTASIFNNDLPGSVYCIDFTLNDGSAWCIDSTGYSGSQDNQNHCYNSPYYTCQ